MGALRGLNSHASYSSFYKNSLKSGFLGSLSLQFFSAYARNVPLPALSGYLSTASSESNEF